MDVSMAIQADTQLLIGFLVTLLKSEVTQFFSKVDTVCYHVHSFAYVCWVLFGKVAKYIKSLQTPMTNDPLLVCHQHMGLHVQTYSATQLHVSHRPCLHESNRRIKSPNQYQSGKNIQFQQVTHQGT
jgi:uncharacterized protein with PQ loop repeat